MYDNIGERIKSEEENKNDEDIESTKHINDTDYQCPQCTL
jgi:hypothetical protein